MPKKTVLVTGGAIRVGRSICECLADAGYDVAVHYHRSSAEAAALRKARPAFTFHQADLTKVRGITKLVASVAERHGRIDVLVNSAAIFYPAPVGKTTEAAWNALHALNLKAPYFLVQAARPYMPKGASIVNITDVSGPEPLPEYIPYALTKAGLTAMTYGLARELAPEIRVNAVAPGPVLLPTWYDKRERKRSVERTLLKREGTPEDVARAVRFLIENEFITGAVLPVDGGRATSTPRRNS